MIKELTKNYCCKTCGNEICRHSALYGGGECKSCSRKAEKHFRFKGAPSKQIYHCIDCDNKISYDNFLHGNKRCRSCSKRGSLNSNFDNGEKISGKLNPCYGLFGKNHPGYTDGLSDVKIVIRHSSKGRQWIKDCMIRDNFKCQDCDASGTLEVHHLIYFQKIFSEFISLIDNNLDRDIIERLSQFYSDFWNINNGITLCKKCHKVRHAKEK